MPSCFKLSFLASLLACLAGSSVSAEQLNWPEFRGPSGNGQSTVTGLPVTWSETENVKWKTPVPGKAWASPVVWGDEIWLSNATEDGKKLSAVCLDLNTGKVKHDVTTFETENPQFSHSFNSHASPTPVIEDGRIYLHYGSTGTFCLDTKTLKILWSRLDLPCDHFRGPGSSPIVFENLLIVPFDGYDLNYVVALDKRTGKTVWKQDRNIKYKSSDGDAHKAYGTCSIIEAAGRTQLVAPSADATMSYDARTGEELWRVRHGGMNVSARPLFGFGKLFINTGHGGLKLFALRPDGHGDVTDTHIDWTYSKTVPTRPSQLLIGEHIYMITDAGVAVCLEAQTGKEVWAKRFGGDYSASPVYADGRIYCFAQDGRSPVFAASPEFNQLAENQLGDGYMASPAVVDKALIVRSRSHVYRLEKLK